MYIEIEGLQHYIDPKQIIADFHRDYYSNLENHFTFRITNQLVENHLSEITDAIAKLLDSQYLTLTDKNIILLFVN